MSIILIPFNLTRRIRKATAAIVNGLIANKMGRPASMPIPHLPCFFDYKHTLTSLLMAVHDFISLPILLYPSIH